MKMNYSEFNKEADALLFSPEFRELQIAIEFEEPNIWQILGISRREMMVSKFLGWLLNPNAKHSFKDKFLKKFIIRSLQYNEDIVTELSPVSILLCDLSAAKVHTEYWLGTRRVDILIYEPKSGLLFMVENKISARESQQQTIDYYKNSQEEFSIDQYPKRIYIYLTPNKVPASNKHFLPLSYSEVIMMIQEFLAEEEMSDTSRYLLTQFHENILRGIAMDQRTIDLAQSIYEKYQNVFDFIYANIEDELRDTEEEIEKIWDGKSWFFNCGETKSSSYKWNDYKRNSFIIAGGGARYREIMKRFKVGDEVYVYLSGKGYVGIGTITKKALPFWKAKLQDGRKLTEIDLDGSYNASQNDEVCEWVALIDWEWAVDGSQAVREQPISQATAARIYQHRMDMIARIRDELEKR